MIKYSLRCAQDHVFEEWFDNSAAYDARAQAGELACPDCGEARVSKAIMAPNVAKAAAPAPAPCGAAGCGGGACAFADQF